MMTLSDAMALADATIPVTCTTCNGTTRGVLGAGDCRGCHGTGDSNERVLRARCGEWKEALRVLKAEIVRLTATPLAKVSHGE